MTYLVLCAMQDELDAFKEGLEGKEEEVNGLTVYHVTKGEKEIYTSLGGIGKVSMAYRLGLLLSSIKADYLFNVGVAGSISPSLDPLMTLVATKACYHDVDVRAFGYSMGQMCQHPKYYECDKDMVEKARSLDPEKVRVGLILSGDSFITKDHIKPSFFTDFDSPLACDMESAAVCQVAYDAKVPVVIIRTISDSPSAKEENKEQYEALLPEACRGAGALARRLILD